MRKKLTAKQKSLSIDIQLVLRTPLLVCNQFVENLDFDVRVIKLQVLSQLSSTKLCLPNRHSVAKCRHSDLTIFLTLIRQMEMDNINLSRNLVKGHSKRTSHAK